MYRCAARGQSGVLITVFCGSVLPLAVARMQASPRIERLNRAFLEHIQTLGPQQALPVERVRRGWRETFRARAPGSFVPQALGVLRPKFAEALRAYDEGRTADVLRLADPLCRDSDPYVRANAAYLYARALVQRGLHEEAAGFLADATSSAADPASYTPYAPHLLLLRGYSEARSLRFEAATNILKELSTRFPDAPEAVAFGVRQMLLELERRERGTLDEVATLMTYAADRLNGADASDRVRERQERVVALLDELIRRNEQRERSQRGSGGRAALPRGSPPRPAEASRAPAGPGRIGDLHAAPQVRPGEAWGRLPPAEREKILQALHERFPSRYRQLVEQYYRSLAEEKE